jgi:hypothetical protein
MESSHLNTIVDELRQERAALQEKITHLRSQLEGLESDRQRIDAAEKALSGEATKPNGAKTGRTKVAKASPSPKKADVVAAMTRVLRSAGELSLDALKRTVEGDLTAEGFNRSGFAMRFREACEDALFLPTDGGLRLATPSQVVANETSGKHVQLSSGSRATLGSGAVRDVPPVDNSDEQDRRPCTPDAQCAAKEERAMKVLQRNKEAYAERREEKAGL